MRAFRQRFVIIAGGVFLVVFLTAGTLLAHGNEEERRLQMLETQDRAMSHCVDEIGIFDQIDFSRDPRTMDPEDVKIDLNSNVVDSLLVCLTKAGVLKMDPDSVGGLTLGEFIKGGVIDDLAVTPFNQQAIHEDHSTHEHENEKSYSDAPASVSEKPAKTYIYRQGDSGGDDEKSNAKQIWLDR